MSRAGRSDKSAVSAADQDVLVDDRQVGAIFRAIRIHRRLRQTDVARAARISPSTVARIERGSFVQLPLETIRAVAAALEIRLDLMASWRGGDLDRVVNARHSVLHEILAARLGRCDGWVSEAEVSYSIYGERGVIDRLAYHREHRMLAAFEIKTDLTDPAGLIAQLDRYSRLAPRIARERGWDPSTVSRWAIVADTDSNRRRLAAHVSLLRGALPAEGRELRSWLRDPARRVDGLAFIAYPHAQTLTRNLGATKRVRLARPKPGGAREPGSVA